MTSRKLGLGTVSSLAIIAGIVVCAPVAHAQATSQAQAASDTIETVVVTAERRSQSAQKTSISLTALNDEDLQNAGVKSQLDLDLVSPSLTMTPTGLVSFPNIRGIGINAVAPTVVSGVALYRDGLFYGGNILADEPYYDIGDVEVLRGPQGTIVGQNSTGGAILVNSRNPSFDGFNGYIEAVGGNFTDVGVTGAVNLPISDTLAARISFNDEHRDSFYNVVGEGLTTPSRLGNLNQSNLRLGLLWQPASNLSILWKTSYNLSDNDGLATKPLPGTPYAVLDSPNHWTITEDRTDSKQDEMSFRTGVEVKYTLPDGIVLRSMSGYQYAQEPLVGDLDGTNAPNAADPALPGIWTQQFFMERFITQEINVISPDEGILRWIVGATYYHRSVPTKFTNYQQYVGGPIEPTLVVDTDNPGDSYGMFGQASIELTSSLELQAGLRYSGDWVGSHGAITIPAISLVLPNTQPFSDNKLTGKVGLNWTVNDENFLYAFVARGYKAGGPNFASNVTFQPEHVYDYEAGWKASWLGQHVTTQFDGYYTQYYNFQSNVFNPQTTSGLTSNLGGVSTIYGLELQAQGKLDHWTFNLNAAWLHSKMGSGKLIDTRLLPAGNLGTQCPAGTPSNPPICFDYSPYYVNISNTQDPFAPEYTANLGIQYDFNFEGGTLTPGITFSYTSMQYASLFNNPLYDKMGDRRLLGAQLSYEVGQWQVALHGTNLTNQYYKAGLNGNLVFMGAPAQYGIRVTRLF